jgi:hypothetical protein
MAHHPRLASWIDPARLAPVFQRHGRLHVPDIFEADFAKALTDSLAAHVPWSHTIAVNGKGYDASLEALARLPKGVRDQIWAGLAESARNGFQYDFESWRVSDELEAGRRAGDALAPVEAVYDFLNSETFLTFVRRLTQDQRPAYCDAQATRYRAGHFLNTHDDEIEGKARLYAYVLNLTPAWRADWGGLLLFHDADGHIAEGLTPRHNTLNIFRVPQSHSVSQVASFVTASRLSITGWIRTAAARPGALP